MPKEIGKHIQFYMDCMNNGGVMPSCLGMNKGGLCLMAECGKIDLQLLNTFAFGQSIYKYWADESHAHILSHDAYVTRFVFNSLRQTIVLFMAAMNNEL